MLAPPSNLNAMMPSGLSGQPDLESILFQQLPALSCTSSPIITGMDYCYGPYHPSEPAAADLMVPRIPLHDSLCLDAGLDRHGLDLGPPWSRHRGLRTWADEQHWGRRLAVAAPWLSCCNCPDDKWCMHQVEPHKHILDPRSLARLLRSTTGGKSVVQVDIEI